MPPKAKGDKKIEMEKEEGDEDAAESAAVKGAEMEEFKADIKKDIQDMKYAQDNYKVTMEGKMATIEEKMADQSRDVNRMLRMMETMMGQKPADITASAPPAMPGADYGGTQQNLNTAMQTPVPGAGLGSEGGGKLEEKEASRTVSVSYTHLTLPTTPYV